MVIKPTELECHVLPGESPAPQERDLYCAAYRLWSRVWSTTFRELDGDPTCHSDNFTRQSRIIVLTHLGAPIALTTQHDVDFSLPTAREDSYFKIWSDESIQKLTRDGTRIVVGSGTVVAPEFRGDLGGGLKLKNLLMALTARCLMDSRSDALMGIARCSRGIQHATHRTGAEVIESGRVMHHEEVELVAWFRRALLAGTVQDLLVERLWGTRAEQKNFIQPLRKAA